jgi:hypothetical protein
LFKALIKRLVDYVLKALINTRNGRIGIMLIGSQAINGNFINYLVIHQIVSRQQKTSLCHFAYILTLLQHPNINLMIVRYRHVSPIGRRKTDEIGNW